jgi:hypothetical protein
LYIASVKRLAFVLLFVISSVAVRAQEISPLASFEFGSPLFFNRDPGVLNQFGSDSTGKSTSYSYGIGADVRWPRLLGSFGVSTNLQFIYSKGNFNFDQVGATVDGIDRKLRLELDALGTIGKWSARAGGWVSSRVSANVYEHDSLNNLITPATATSSPTHLGVTVGTGYRLENIRTSLFGNYDLTPGAGSKGLSAGISLAYVFGDADTADDRSERSSPIVRISQSSVKFTINDSDIRGDVPVEKVEKHVHEYTMQKDTILFREWIEESYHLPHIRLKVTSRDTAFVAITANGSLLNRYRIKRDTSLTINELSALDIHKTNRIAAQVENGASSDTLILPEISSNLSNPIVSQNEYRFHLLDNDSTRFGKLVEEMTSILPKVKDIVVRTPHGESWEALTQKLRTALGTKAKYKQAYNAKEMNVVMSD